MNSSDRGPSKDFSSDLRSELHELRVWALFPTAEPSDPAERRLHTLRAEQAWIRHGSYAWWRYEDLIEVAQKALSARLAEDPSPDAASGMPPSNGAAIDQTGDTPPSGEKGEMSDRDPEIWHPINTAPKDGALVDLWVDDPPCSPGCYENCWWGEYTSEFGFSPRTEVGWCTITELYGDITTRPVEDETAKATHWSWPREPKSPPADLLEKGDG